MPGSRKSEQRRRAKTARAETAVSARKVGALWGGGAVTGSAAHAGCCHSGDGGAREARSFGARHGPAPNLRKDEQRRGATTARAVTATSAQKVGVPSGCGAVLSVAEHAG